MTWGMQRTGMQVADAETFFVHQQDIELTAITGEAGFSVEQVTEHLLHLSDVSADGCVPTELFLQIRRCRKMIGMDMGFQDPLHLRAQGFYPGNQTVGRGGAGPS
ncbi:hypothetical protein D3C71_1835670 [compost metagenome]